MNTQPDTRNTKVRDLMSGFSIELIPSPNQQVASKVAALPRGTEVFLPYAASTRPEDVISAAIELRSVGMVPVPHIPARRIESGAGLSRYVESLRDKAKVDTALVLGGDVDTPVGPFSCSMDVLLNGALSDNGFSRIGFAGHPEGHPNILASELISAMAAKLEYTRKLGAEPFVVSQFSFSARPFLAWQSDVIGPVIGSTPIRFGIPGLVGLRTLIRFAVECGVGTSFELVRKNMSKAFKLAAEFQPEQIVSDLASGLPDSSDDNRFGIHFYPFGSFMRTADWASSAVSEEV